MEPVDSRAKHLSATFRMFRGTLISWNELFQQAADFATAIGPDRLISISHSSDQSDGIVTIWYWR
jgi:hypothetical protein